MGKLIPPLGDFITVKCVDNIDTRVHEDGFRIAIKGNKAYVDLAAVKPPMLDGQMRKLKRELVSYLPYYGVESPGFIEKFNRREHGLSNEYLRDAIVVSCDVNLTNGNTSPSTIKIVKVCGDMWTYESYNSEKASLDENFVLMKILYNPNHKGLKRRIFQDEIFKEFKEKGNIGAQNVFIANKLFNDTCRIAAYHLSIPYITRSNKRKDLFRFHGPDAKFNCSLRDPCAYVNAANLADDISNVPLIFDRNFLKNHLTIGLN